MADLSASPEVPVSAFVTWQTIVENWQAMREK
jgi:hypothetical protein